MRRDTKFKLPIQLFPGDLIEFRDKQWEKNNSKKITEGFDSEKVYKMISDSGVEVRVEFLTPKEVLERKTDNLVKRRLDKTDIEFFAEKFFFEDYPELSCNVPNEYSVLGIGFKNIYRQKVLSIWEQADMCMMTHNSIIIKKEEEIFWVNHNYNFSIN